MKRRKFLATAGAIGAAGLSGCLFENTPLNQNKLQSRPATVPQFVFERTVFDEHKLEEINTTKTVGFRGEESEIDYTEWSSRYGTVDVDSVENLWIRTYPKRKIGDKILKPRDISSVRDALEQTDTAWEEWVIESQSRNYDITILDSDVEVNEYMGAVGSSEAGAVNSRFFFCQFEHESEVLACFGAVPESSSSYDDYLSMLQSIVHPSESVEQEIISPRGGGKSTESNQTDSS